MGLYKGYVPTSNKKAQMAFKDKGSSDLLTLEEAQRYSEYAGILADDTVLVDIDDGEQSQTMLKIVKSKGLKCKVIATTRGMHFLFKTDEQMQNRTHCRIIYNIYSETSS